MLGNSKNPFSFLNELRRRKVVKAALVYAAVAYTILQASDIIFPRLGLPDWTVTFVMILLIIGLILTIVLSWVYDITPEGLQITKTEGSKPQENVKVQPENDNELRDINDSPEAGLDKGDLNQQVQTQESSPKEVNRTILKPKSRWITGFKKYIFPIVVVAVLFIVVFKWQSLTQIVGFGNSKREVAKSHVENAVKYFDIKDYEAAKAELELALASDPKYSYAWSTLAAVSVKQGNLNDAILQTIEAIKFDPTNAIAAYNMAIALDDKKDFHQAIEWYTKAIKIDSTLVPAYSALGRLYNVLNQPVDAILILSQARDKYPESEFIYLIYKNLGNSHLLMNQFDEAIKFLELSIEIKPTEAETNLYLAKACEAAGKMTRSIDVWQNYIELETDTAKILEAKNHLKEITIRHLQEIIK